MSEKNLIEIFPIGDKNDAYAQYFDGQSYLNVISDSQVFIANVTFELSCRNLYNRLNRKGKSHS